jgi:hypothetical protein
MHRDVQKAPAAKPIEMKKELKSDNTPTMRENKGQSYNEDDKALRVSRVELLI